MRVFIALLALALAALAYTWAPKPKYHEMGRWTCPDGWNVYAE